MLKKDEQNYEMKAFEVQNVLKSLIDLFQGVCEPNFNRQQFLVR